MKKAIITITLSCLFAALASTQTIPVRDQHFFKAQEIIGYVCGDTSVFLNVSQGWYPYLIKWGYKRITIFESDEKLPLLPFMQTETIFAEIFPLHEEYENQTSDNCILKTDYMLPILAKVKLVQKNEEKPTKKPAPEGLLTQTLPQKSYWVEAAYWFDESPFYFLDGEGWIRFPQNR